MNERSAQEDALPAMPETYCYAWVAPAIWPHASVDPFAVQTTFDRAKVTCASCLHTLGTQKTAPPWLSDGGTPLCRCGHGTEYHDPALPGCAECRCRRYSHGRGDAA